MVIKIGTAGADNLVGTDACLRLTHRTCCPGEDMRDLDNARPTSARNRYAHARLCVRS